MNKKTEKLAIVFWCLIQTLAAIQVNVGSAQTKFNADVLNKANFYGTIIGYGGNAMAEFESQKLVDFLDLQVKNKTRKSDIVATLRKGIVDFDTHLFKNSKAIYNTAGATLCLIYIAGNTIYCVNLGDNNALLFSNKVGASLPAA